MAPVPMPPSLMPPSMPSSLLLPPLLLLLLPPLLLLVVAPTRVLLLLLLLVLFPSRVVMLVHEGRTIPDTYSYHEKHEQLFVTREFLMHEMSPRVRMICPRGYYIGGVTMALQLGPDAPQEHLENPVLSRPCTHLLYDNRNGGEEKNKDEEPPGEQPSQNENIEDDNPADDYIADEDGVHVYRPQLWGSHEYIPPAEGAYETCVSLCPSMSRCLGHAGCVFNYGNEFCGGDALPGFRKVLDVNVTCVNVSLMEEEKTNLSLTGGDTSPPQTEEETNAPLPLGKTSNPLTRLMLADGLVGGRIEHHISGEEVEKRMARVAHLQYPSSADTEVPDYTTTNITVRAVPVEQVLFQTCPRGGFAGTCGGEAPPLERVGDDLWHVLARSPTPQCRGELLQVYCSYQYNPQGLCWPPYAVSGKQPSDDSGAAAVQPSFALYPQEYSSAPHDTPTVLSPRSDLHQLELTHRGTSVGGTFPSGDDGRPAPSLPLSLTPVSLAFLILVHKDVEAVVHQLQLLYSPSYVFVYHVDRRQPQLREQLRQLIGKRFPKGKNIRVLDAGDSFLPSWGSYGIVRAELQGLRELLGFPNWEYVVKLSGADLPLRSPEDLSFLLAPHRGNSILPSFKMRNTPEGMLDQGLSIDVWHGCGGHVFNVTRGAGQPPPSDLEIHVGSQWSIPHRSLVEHMFAPPSPPAPPSLTPHSTPDDGLPPPLSLPLPQFPSTFRRWLYYLSTSIIPDEVFTHTALRNSPLRNRFLSTGLHWLKTFQGRNALHLCRHTDDTDFCGQGPSLITPDDWPQLAESSHRHFFARKFLTSSPTAPARSPVASHVGEGYYKGLLRHLPPQAVREMVGKALGKLMKQGRLPRRFQWRGDADYKIRFLPRLDSPPPCCHLAFNFTYKMVQTFRAVLDFRVKEKGGRGWVWGRASLLPQAAFTCYPDGHLRAIRVTTWTRDPSLEEDVPGPGPLLQLAVNTPLMGRSAPISQVFLELWIHAGTKSIEGECEKSPAPPGVAIHFSNLNVSAVTADPIEWEGWVEDQRGRQMCRAVTPILWSPDTVRVNMDGERIELPSPATLPCGEPLVAGRYRVLLRQLHVNGARVYEMPLLVLPPGEPSQWGLNTASPARGRRTMGGSPSQRPKHEEEFEDWGEHRTEFGSGCPNCGRLPEAEGAERMMGEEMGVLGELWEMEEVGVVKRSASCSVADISSHLDDEL